MKEFRSKTPWGSGKVTLAACGSVFAMLLILTTHNQRFVLREDGEASIAPLADISATRNPLGASHAYVLTANELRLKEMTTMLDYAGIEFTPHLGPNVWSGEFNETYHKVFPDSSDDDFIYYDGRRDLSHVERDPSSQQRRSIPQHDKRAYRRRFRYALACLLGHRGIWQDALARQHDSILVFEDDIDINVNIARIMEDVWQRIPDDWDLLLLGHDRMRHWWGDEEPQEFDLFGRLDNTYGMFAYFVRGRALPSLLQGTSEKMSDPIDQTVTWDMALEKKIVMYGAWPVLAYQLPVPSLIQDRLTDTAGGFGYNGMAFSSGAWNRVTVS